MLPKMDKPICRMRVKELQQRLHERGLPTSGLRDVLINRLTEFLASQSSLTAHATDLTPKQMVRVSVADEDCDDTASQASTGMSRTSQRSSVRAQIQLAEDRIRMKQYDANQALRADEQALLDERYALETETRNQQHALETKQRRLSAMRERDEIATNLQMSEIQADIIDEADDQDRTVVKDHLADLERQVSRNLNELSQTAVVVPPTGPNPLFGLDIFSGDDLFQTHAPKSASAVINDSRLVQGQELGNARPTSRTKHFATPTAETEAVAYAAPHFAACPPSVELDSQAYVWPAAQDPRVSKHVSERYIAPPQPQPAVDSTRQLHELYELMSLPKSQLVPFDGDPMSFHVFWNSFRTNVDASRIPDGAKLTRLLDACQGKARKLIKPCALGDPTEGYRDAMKLLKSRFGNDYVISESFVNSIISGPAVKAYDGPSLQEFTDDVRSCVQTLRRMGHIQEIDARTRLQKLVDRLPNNLQNTWRSRSITYLEQHDKYPGIDMFLAFLERACKEANDPIVGYRKSRGESRASDSKPVHTVNNQRYGNKHSGHSRAPVSSFVTDADDIEATNLATNFTLRSSDAKRGTFKQYTRTCLLCSKDSHMFAKCPDLLKLSLERRLATVRDKKVCFNCLKPGNHIAKECRSEALCGIDGCNIKHNALLHEAFKKHPAKEVGERISTDVNNVSIQNFAISSLAKRFSLPIVRVKVKKPRSSEYVSTYALIDGGSTRSFCSIELARALTLSGPKVSLDMSTMHEESVVIAQQVAISVDSDADGIPSEGGLELQEVFAVDSFPAQLSRSVSSVADLQEYPHLSDLGIPDVDDVSVWLLIGQDGSDAMYPLETRRGNPGEPHAIRTVLGWIVNGQLNKAKSQQAASSFSITTMDASALTEQVERFWKIDNVASIGPDCQPSVNDRKVLQLWDRTVSLEGERYQLDIPFKSLEPNLPHNYVMAEKRLAHLERKLERDPEMKMKYSSGINDLLMKGHAEPAPLSGPDGLTWYIPHHVVTNPNKPGKIRIVFDCAATSGGTSLNREVHQGPDLTNKLIGVLLRFRERPVAIMADVEAMFHQIRVSPKHRDALRFLWRDAEGTVQAYRLCVHLFGGIWSPSAATYALRRTAEEFGAEHQPNAAAAVMEKFYVDDLLDSLPTDDDAIRLYGDLRALLSRRCFNLTKFISSSRVVLEAIDPEHRAPAFASIDLNESTLPSDTALGMCWFPEDDTLGIRVKSRDVVYTRRGLLSTLSSLYDPLGFIAPFILVAKLILQDETRLNKPWDAELDQQNREKLEQWIELVPLMREVFVPRYIAPAGSVVRSVQLHHFADASKLAFGTASYLRVTLESGDVICTFVFGKSRLAPIQTLTIPRLELKAAVAAVKNDVMLKREMKLRPESTHFWSDSSLVLGQIYNRDRRFDTFTANRISTIHSSSEPEQWKHVPTEVNPADKASRGTADLRENWLCAPTFLSMPPDEWPRKFSIGESVPVLAALTSCVDDVESNDATEVESYIANVSSWYKLLRRVAWLLLVCARFKHKRRDEPTRLTPALLDSAEVEVIRSAQASSYEKEIKDVNSRGAVSKGSSLYKLEPWLDESGLLRAGGRLDNMEAARDVKHPVILPPDHRVTLLYLRHVHFNEAAHSGSEYVMSIARKKYWIVRGRAVARGISSDCFMCRRLRHKGAEQRMAALPAERVTPDNPPFHDVGVDCFGPFSVRVKRSTVKRYGCIFTCLAVRAIHIEVLESMDTSSFINALRRFISRRGKPTSIRSDHGTNFVGANTELQVAVNQWNEDSRVGEYLLQSCIKWNFNPPGASHFGGVWERLIRSVRRAIETALRTLTPSDECLMTIMCEAEAIVNGRPITPVSSDVNDRLALTPNDMLLLRSSATLPPVIATERCIYNRRWKEVQHIADQFWIRWTAEYLPLLRSRQKWVESKRNVQVGDIVLVINESTPRNQWPLGRVIEVFPGADGFVRSVCIRTRGTVLRRPVAKLCLLETEGLG